MAGRGVGVVLEAEGVMTERHLRKYIRVHAPFEARRRSRWIWFWWEPTNLFSPDASDISSEVFAKFKQRPESSGPRRAKYSTAYSAFQDLIQALRRV